MIFNNLQGHIIFQGGGESSPYLTPPNYAHAVTLFKFIFVAFKIIIRNAIPSQDLFLNITKTAQCIGKSGT